MPAAASITVDAVSGAGDVVESLITLEAPIAI